MEKNKKNTFPLRGFIFFVSLKGEERKALCKTSCSVITLKQEAENRRQSLNTLNTVTDVPIRSFRSARRGNFSAAPADHLHKAGPSARTQLANDGLLRESTSSGHRFNRTRPIDRRGGNDGDSGGLLTGSLETCQESPRSRRDSPVSAPRAALNLPRGSSITR